MHMEGWAVQYLIFVLVGFSLDESKTDVYFFVDPLLSWYWAFFDFWWTQAHAWVCCQRFFEESCCQDTKIYPYLAYNILYSQIFVVLLSSCQQHVVILYGCEILCCCSLIFDGRDAMQDFKENYHYCLLIPNHHHDLNCFQKSCWCYIVACVTIGEEPVVIFNWCITLITQDFLVRWM